MRPFVVTSPDSTEGFSTEAWTHILSLELGPPTAELKEIGISGDGITRWRILGLGDTSIVIKPDLPISFPVAGTTDRAIKIEAQSDGTTTVYPVAYISGGIK